MISRHIKIVSASLLLLLSLAALVYSVRASVAGVLYYRVRYADEEHYLKNPDEAAEKCSKSCSLYPYNFYLYAWMAEGMYHNRLDEKGKIIKERLERAEEWCDRGLELNNLNSQLRILKARLISERDPMEAAGYLAPYVEWNFWEPYHHAVMVEFYAKAGDFTRATEEIEWVKGSGSFDYASRELKAAWKREMLDMEPPPAP